jgi:oxygen-independent coproporphyrinogen-3 oxidase
MKIGLYIHIPFCRQKCYYCDFPSYAGYEAQYSDYVAALCREIAGKGGLFSRTVVDTVYVGGGTPTILPEQLLSNLLESLHRNWRLADDAEISIEANPGTVDRLKLNRLRQQGVNRISFGVQAFSNRLLRALGRVHNKEEAIDALELARHAGFRNISLDLMYGLPGQSLTDWEESMAIACDLGVEHISAYGLKVEEGTPFFELERQGRLLLPDEDQDVAMYDRAAVYFPLRGFRRYEISNYAIAGFECRHNRKYWRYQPYIGLGSAAHSFLGGKRSANTVRVREYIECVREGKSPVAFEETLTEADSMAEFVFLALRTAEGLQFAEFQRQFGVEFWQRFATQTEELVSNGLLKRSAQGVMLTARGMKFGNIAFAAFLPDKP